jgi:hypothetical protein
MTSGFPYTLINTVGFHGSNRKEVVMMKALCTIVISATSARLLEATP